MHKLYAKFNILMVVVVVATMLGLYIQYTHSQTIVYDNAQKIADISAGVLKEEIEGWLSQKAQLVDDLANIVSMNRLNNEELLAYLKVLLQKNPDFSSLYFGSVDNRMLNASGWQPPPGFDLRRRPWYVVAQVQNKLVITEAFLNASKDDLIVTIAKPVYTAEGELLGVIAGDVSVMTIVKLVNEKKNGNNGYSFLVDGNNKMLAHPNYQYDLKSGAPELDVEYLSFAKQVKQVPAGVIRYSLNGKDGFVAYHQIGNTTWMLGSFVSLADLINPAEQLKRSFVIALAISSMILSVLFLLLMKFIITPLVQLNESVNQIDVEREPSYRIPVSGSDEVAMVSRTINSMLSNAEFFLSRLRANDEEIRTREEKYVNIISGTHAGTWEWNVQTGEIVIDERWAEIMGYTLEELQPFNAEKGKQMMHPEDLADVNEAIQQHFRRESEYCKSDSRMRQKNGSWVWTYDCGKVTKWDDGGRPIKMFGTRIDITKRKMAEEAQRRNAQIQSVLREIAETAITASSLDELYAAVYRLTTQVLPSDVFHLALLDERSNQIVDGYSRDAQSYVAKRRPVGKGLTEYTLKQRRTIHMTADILHRLLESGEVVRQSCSPIHEWLGSPLFSSSGKGIGVLTVISRTAAQSFQAGDVEVLAIIAAQVAMAIERKQTEASLKASQVHYRALVDQSFEALALVDIKKKEAVEINRKFTELLGYSLPDDAPLFESRYMIDTEQNLAKRYNMTLPQQRFLPVEAQVLRHKNGTNVYVEQAGTVIDIAGIDYLLISSRDLTAERRYQAELVRDVEFARRVQCELLPKVANSPFVTIQTLYHPSSGVSGDSYHMEWLNGGKLLRGFLIDVTGHGLGTAIQTSSINVLLREAAATNLSLLEMMQWINVHAMSCFAEGAYAALLGFELDLLARELRYVGAGITQFYANYKRVATPGMFIGLWEQAEFGFAKMPITAGDVFCFLTDGFTDVLEQPNNTEVVVSNSEDFEAHVAVLQQLAGSGRLRDDATGICLQIKDLP